jgi:outer membrane protein OmpA-like peptidoglycan-associated protein
VGLGISRNRIQVEYFSENKPIATNENDDGRQFNRRAELHFVQNDEIAFTSVKLRKGVESIRVDHSLPKGQPGYDQPDPNTPVSLNEAPGAASQPLAGQAPADAAAAPVAVAPIDLQHIYFDFDRDNLRADAVAELDQVADLLISHPDWLIQLDGHTDSQGDDSYNLKLSQRRCEATRQYLLAKGISADRLVDKAHSEHQPLASNADEAGRQLNRRVEFSILQADGGMAYHSTN